MPKVKKEMVVRAPLEDVFAYVDTPANLPEIWPSLFQVKDVQKLPNGGHKFRWLYNMAGMPSKGEFETIEHVDYQRIVEHSKGDIEGTFTWTFRGENGNTKVAFEADYATPPYGKELESFIVRRGEYEADALLANLKARLELYA